ncbi:acyltransferase family protein [Marinomonas atlantica]|uniref:acyltransferase family protein n=1 Tax=Marinomonas atlantica TaxID=1806668 RepID=UPI00082F28F5|nr:acyltransferase [Marinomonas atlantica]
MNSLPLASPAISQKLSVAADNTDNNLHLIRILCAWGVLFAHSYVLTGMAHDITDPFERFLNIGMGTFFVVVFFAISGFLIQRSLLRSSSLSSYFQARALRLLPALFITLLLTVFALGPLTSTLSVSDYFTQPLTWQYFYNLNLLDIHTQFILPAVFTQNIYPNTVNGSIWTLPFETWMYVMTVVFYCLQQIILSKWTHFKPVLSGLSLVCVSLFILVAGYYFQTESKQQHYDILLFVSTFFIGANAYNFRTKIQLNWWTMCLLLAGIPWLKDSILAALYLPITICYTVLVLAYLPQGWIRKYNALGDYSYGLYIYAFPVQQSLAHWFAMDFLTMVIATTAITLPLAILSWHFIEAPALKLKKNRRALKPT